MRSISSIGPEICAASFSGTLCVARNSSLGSRLLVRPKSMPTISSKASDAAYRSRGMARPGNAARRPSASLGGGYGAVFRLRLGTLRMGPG